MAIDFGSRLHIVERDLRCFDFPHCYELVIAHGVLHLLPRVERVAVLDRIEAKTVVGGTNVVAVFTDRLPPDWDVVVEQAYTLHDEHPGGIRHEHAVNKLVALRPS